MTLVTHTYPLAQPGFATFRTTTGGTITSTITNGALSQDVAPGQTYVRVVLQTLSFDEVLVIIPASGPVDLSTLVPQVPAPVTTGLLTTTSIGTVVAGFNLAGQVLDKAGNPVVGGSGTPATTTAQGTVKLAGDLAGTADLPTVPGLAAKASSTDPRFTDTRTPSAGTVTSGTVVAGGLPTSAITGTAVVTADTRLSDQRTPVDASVTTAKIAAGGITPTSVTGTAVVTADSRLSDARTPTAHATNHATGGSDPVTAAAIGAAPTTRVITAGTGLTGGGTLAADRALAVTYGSTAGTAAQGNDGRLSDPRAPSGAAGGDLTGTFPNPTVPALAQRELLVPRAGAVAGQVPVLQAGGTLAFATPAAGGGGTLGYVPPIGGWMPSTNKPDNPGTASPISVGDLIVGSPIISGNPLTIGGVGGYCSTGAAGAVLRIGIYAVTTANPHDATLGAAYGTLLLDAGTAPAAAAGRVIINTSQAIPAGTPFFVALVAQVAGVSVFTEKSQASSGLAAQYGSDQIANGGMLGLIMSGVTGPLPTTYTPSSYNKNYGSAGWFKRST